MNTRIPGVVRPTDEDGEADPAITPIQAGLVLVTEYGLPIATDEEEQILVT